MHNIKNWRFAIKVVDDQNGLARMVDRLAGEKVIAFDIECASNLHHYVQRVCLLQFAAGGEAFVVDAIKGLDLSPVGRILEDPRIEIVMHDTDFDLRSLDRDYGWRPKNLFDTLVAARLCGHKEFGLASLLEKHFGRTASKKFQRADWTVRPVPRNMIEYAADDVICLESLRDILAAELIGLGRMPWARAKFKQCEEKRFVPDERPLFARVKHAREQCSPRDMAILKELAEARDEIARAMDLPHYMVVADHVLIALAKDPPRTKALLMARRGLHPECRGRFAGRMVEAAVKGSRAPELAYRWSMPREKGGGYSSSAFDALKAWRSGFAKKMNVEPDLILSMNSLRRLAAGASTDEVLRGEAIGSWRFEEIKEAIQKITRRH